MATAKKKKKSTKPETAGTEGKSGRKTTTSRQGSSKTEKKTKSKTSPPKKTSKKTAGKKPNTGLLQPSDNSHVTPEHITALRRRLNYEIFLKCLEKKYLENDDIDI